MTHTVVLKACVPGHKVEGVHGQLEPPASSTTKVYPQGGGGALPHQGVAQLYNRKLLQVRHHHPQQVPQQCEPEAIDEDVAVQQEDCKRCGKGCKVVVVEKVDHT